MMDHPPHSTKAHSSGPFEFHGPRSHPWLNPFHAPQQSCTRTHTHTSAPLPSLQQGFLLEVLALFSVPRSGTLRGLPLTLTSHSVK